MHVLQLLPALTVGGVERGVLDLAKGLIARGHRVTVVSAGGPLVEPLTQLGATHHQLPVHAKSLATISSCIPELVHLIRTTGVDVVHARSRVPAWSGFIAARRAQRPFVTTIHGFYKPHPGSRVMMWGRSIIVPSEAVRRYVMEHFDMPKERLHLIPRGVDIDAFQFQPPPSTHEGPWRIGLFGRLSAQIKGHRVALQACALLRDRGLSFQLCLAGDTPDAPLRQTYEALINTLRLEGAVEWLGVRQDMAALLASMDLILVPSRYPESFGRSIVEAHAVGRPVIASRVGAFEELIEDGQSGLLVPPEHAELLTVAMERMMNDPALRQRCIATARQRVEERYSLDRMVEGTLAVYEECLTRPRVLIWKLSALGDVILSTPSLRSLRRQFPQGHLTLAVGRAAYEVVARCPYLDDVLIYDPSGKDRGLRGSWGFLRRLRHGRFDYSVDLQNSRKTHLMAWLAGIPVRVGFHRKLGGLLNRRVRLPRVVLAPIAHQQHLLREAGFFVNGEALELWPSPLDETRAAQLLGPAAGASRQRPLIGMHPGGSGRWLTKRWDLTRWMQLCRLLQRHGADVVVTGGPDERTIADAMQRALTPRPLIVIGQTSLMELACLIKRCDVFLTHDSAALHVAAAVGTPTVALFGPTDPRRHVPPTFAGVILKKDVLCSPCYAARCRTITHACMKRISVEEVFKAALGLLPETDAAEQAPV